MLNEAIELANKGWHILPVGMDKMPVTEHGFLDATTDRGQLEDWHSRGLLKNIAVSCAASGMFVVDVDPRNGGFETLNALMEEHGGLPYTVQATTAGGGIHYYFRLPTGLKLRGRLGLGIDIKSKGYAILPPSTLANGGSYAWVSSPERAGIAEAPPWLHDLVVKPQPVIKPFTPGQAPQDSRPGDRYNQETSWESLLHPLGWRVAYTDGEETYWTRPGKDEGVSASTNYAGTGLMYVFTSSTDLEPEQCYSQFNFLAITQYGGDHSAAARDLAERYRLESGALFATPYGHDNSDEPTSPVEVVSPRPEEYRPAFDEQHFITRYVNDTALQTDAAREYAEAAALVLLSGVTQTNRINLSSFPGGLRTNLYVLLVGQSTKSRKSTVQRISSSIANSCTPGAALPSRMTTEALINELSNRSGMPSLWFPDEFGITLSQIMDRSYLKGVEEMLLTVYSGDNYSYLKADGTAIRINQPHLSVLAAATPESLGFAGPQATMSGLIPRFAMVYPETPPLRPVGMMPQLQTVQLTKDLMEIRNWAATPPAEVTFEPDALACLNEAEMQLLSRGLSVARLPAMLYKVASLSALASKRRVVALSDAESSVVVVGRWATGAERLAPVLLRKPGDYEFLRGAEEAYETLRNQGGTIHRSGIARVLKTTAAKLDTYQKSLVDWGYIRHDPVTNLWYDNKGEKNG